MVYTHIVVAYLIGSIKYKQLLLSTFDDKQEAIDVYREYLNNHVSNSEFVMVMLNAKHEVLTCWALQTPKNLKPAQDKALSNYESGEDLYVDPNLKLENIFGSAIYDELKKANAGLCITEIPMDTSSN